MPKKKLILYCHKSTEVLGERIADLTRDSVRSQIEFSKDVKWEKFPDGFPNLFIQNSDRCVGNHVVFLGSFHSPELIFEQISLLYVLPRLSVKSLTLVLPYFPTGTMERVDKEGQVATAATMARMLSSTPLSAMGPARVMIFDIHVLQERFFFTDNVLPSLCTAIPRFLKQLEELTSANEQLTIAFPDEGAHKRFSVHFSEFPIIRCIKRRNGSAREVTIVDGDPKGRHVVIVDDLIMTGGTVLDCADVLRRAGAAKVSAYVTHAVFPQESWKKFVAGEEGSSALDTFWITDSLPHASELSKFEPFKLLSLAESIVEALEKFIVMD